MMSINDELENSIKPVSSNTDALRLSIKLLNRFQQNTIFNCPRSGYGADPTDEDDSGGGIWLLGSLALLLREAATAVEAEELARFGMAIPSSSSPTHLHM